MIWNESKKKSREGDTASSSGSMDGDSKKSLATTKTAATPSSYQQKWKEAQFHLREMESKWKAEQQQARQRETELTVKIKKAKEGLETRAKQMSMLTAQYKVVKEDYEEENAGLRERVQVMEKQLAKAISQSQQAQGDLAQMQRKMSLHTKITKQDSIRSAQKVQKELESTKALLEEQRKIAQAAQTKWQEVETIMAERIQAAQHAWIEKYGNQEQLADENKSLKAKLNEVQATIASRDEEIQALQANANAGELLVSYTQQAGTDLQDTQAKLEEAQAELRYLKAQLKEQSLRQQLLEQNNTLKNQSPAGASEEKNQAKQENDIDIEMSAETTLVQTVAKFQELEIVFQEKERKWAQEQKELEASAGWAAGELDEMAEEHAKEIQELQAKVKALERAASTSPQNILRCTADVDDGDDDFVSKEIRDLEAQCKALQEALQKANEASASNLVQSDDSISKELNESLANLQKETRHDEATEFDVMKTFFLDSVSIFQQQEVEFNNREKQWQVEREELQAASKEAANQLEKTRETLTNHLHEVKEKLKDTQMKLEEQTSALSNVELNCRNARESEEKLASLEACLNEGQASKQKLVEELQTTRATLDSRNTLTDALQEELKETKARLTKMRSTATSLAETSKTLECRHAQWIEEQAAWEMERGALQNAVKELQNKIDSSLDEERKAAQIAQEATSRQVQAWEEERASWEVERTSMKESIGALEAKLAAMVADTVSKLSDQKREFSEQSQALQAEKQAVEASLQEKTIELESLTGLKVELDKVNLDVAEKSRLFDELKVSSDKKIEELQNEMKGLVASRDEWETKCVELTAALESSQNILTTEREKWTEERASTSEKMLQVDEIKDSLKEAQTRVDEAEERIVNADQELNLLRDVVAKDKAELQAELQEKDTLQSELKQQKDELAACHKVHANELTILQQQIDLRASQVEKVSAERDEIAGRIMDAESRQSDLLSQVDSLTEELSKVKGDETEVASLRDSLDELQTHFEHAKAEHKSQTSGNEAKIQELEKSLLDRKKEYDAAAETKFKEDAKVSQVTKNERDQALAEAESMKSQLQSLKEKLDEQKKKTQVALGLMDAIKKQRDSEIQSRKELAEQLESSLEMQKAKQTLESDVTSLRRKLEQLEESLQAANEKSASWESKHSSALKSMEQTTNQMTKLQEELKQSREELVQAQSQLETEAEESSC